MKNLNMPKLIADLIIIKRAEVINALETANVSINNQVSDQRLYDIILIELNKPNTELFISLGVVIDQTIDLSPLFENTPPEVYSNGSGLFAAKEGGSATGNFIRSDTGKSVISAGANALFSWVGNKFSGGSSSTSTTSSGGGSTSAGGGNSDMALVIAMQGNAEQQRQAREDARIAEEKASRKTTIIVISIIGGVLVIGGIITAVVLKNKKSIPNPS